jgi:hypothetical protein
MISYQEAEKLLNQWIRLLEGMAAIEIDCEMPPDMLMANLERRQRAIDEIQQLDAPLSEVRRFRFDRAAADEAELLDVLMKRGREISAEIRASNLQIIYIAKIKRKVILEKLQKNSLSKVYNTANQTLRLRPPVIVDGSV